MSAITDPFRTVQMFILSFFNDPSDMVIGLSLFASVGIVIMMIAFVAGLFIGAATKMGLIKDDV